MNTQNIMFSWRKEKKKIFFSTYPVMSEAMWRRVHVMYIHVDQLQIRKNIGYSNIHVFLSFM